MFDYDFKSFFKATAAISVVVILTLLVVGTFVSLVSSGCGSYNKSQYDKGDVPLDCYQEMKK